MLLPLLVDETHLVRFDDQVADRDDQAVVADHDAGALALLAERRAAARVGHCARLDLDDRLEELLGVGRQRARRCGLRLGRFRRRGANGSGREERRNYEGGIAKKAGQ